MILADDMREMLRGDCLPLFVPEAANFRRERRTGTENHLGELVVSSSDTLDLFAIETTGRGKMPDEEQTGRSVGNQIQGEIMLILLEDLLDEGDRVIRISTGDPFKVVSRDAPKLNGVATSYNYRIRKQTD